jgi:hypothetical protein
MTYPASMYNTDEKYTALKAYDIKGSCKAGYIYLRLCLCANI